MDIFKQLEKLSTNSLVDYDNICKKSSALVITENGNEIFGVGIVLRTTNIQTTAISNTICRAVSEGYIRFKKLYVYIASDDVNDLTIDIETKALLDEFGINEFTLFTYNGDMHIQRVEKNIYPI